MMMACNPVAKRPYMNFRLDNSTTDSSLNNIAVTAQNITYDVNQFGQSNKSGVFNGSSSRINFNSTLNDIFKTNFTFIFWIKCDTDNTFYRPFNSDLGLGSATSPWFRTSVFSGQYVFGVGSNVNNRSVTGGTVTTNWQCVAGTCSGNGSSSNIELFVDGVSVGTASGSHQNINSNKMVSIGVLRYQTNFYLDYFAGDMDNIMAYNLTLSAGQIKILNSQKGRLTA